MFLYLNKSKGLKGVRKMSDKLSLKGNVIISEPDVDDWFDFENKVLRAIRNNAYHTVNAVCTFQRYVGTDIMGSFKLDGKLCAWSDFAVLVIATRAEYPQWSISCTVTLKAGKKGKAAEQALENDMDMFATTKADLPFEVYEKNKELIDGMYQAGKNAGVEELDDSENEEENEGRFVKSASISSDEAKRVLSIIEEEGI